MILAALSFHMFTMPKDITACCLLFLKLSKFREFCFARLHDTSKLKLL